LPEFDKGTSMFTTIERMVRIGSGQYFKALEMETITSEEQAVEKLNEAVENGWEGYMIRKADAPYEGKRTRALLKMKKMHDEEYTVKSIETGPFRMIDKSTGLEKTIETLTNIIIDHKGNDVSVGSGFSLEERSRYYENPNLIIGKEITVQYFEKSKDKDGIESLRFPVVKHVFESGKRTV
jgi:DNA ligase-1